jgi:hypothetical protein
MILSDVFDFLTETLKPVALLPVFLLGTRVVEGSENGRQSANPLAECEQDICSMGTGDPASPLTRCSQSGAERVPQDALQLEFLDDLQFPSEAELVVEGLRSPMRIPVTGCHDEENGVYRFTIEGIVPGRQCRIRVETADFSITILEDTDLYSFVQRAQASDDVEPLPLNFTDELFDHFLDYEEFEVDDPPPEPINWEAPPEFDTEDDEMESSDSYDVDIDPSEDN